MNFKVDKLFRVLVTEVAFEYVRTPTARLRISVSKDCIILSKVFFGLKASVFIDDVAWCLTLRLEVGSQLDE